MQRSFVAVSEASAHIYFDSFVLFGLMRASVRGTAARRRENTIEAQE